MIRFASNIAMKSIVQKAVSKENKKQQTRNQRPETLTFETHGYIL